MPLQRKIDRLRAALADAGSAAVAFSGGADSSFLLLEAHRALGRRAVAVTVRSALCPSGDVDAAAAFCRTIGAAHEILDFDPFAVPGFAANGPDRCYTCKRAMFSALKKFAAERGLERVIEGSNADDDGDYRPGRRALRELGAESPLRDAGFSKAEIRDALRGEGLDAASKPPAACLASRVPYGERLSPELLARIGRAEDAVRAILGGGGPARLQVRVRAHGAAARVETDPSAIAQAAAKCREISAALKAAGFAYASLDLDGYRTGSLNETLPAQAAAAESAGPAGVDMGFANIDIDRLRRQGMCETVYGEGKTAAQIAAILRAMREHGQAPVLVTRIDAAKSAAAAEAAGPDWEYFPEARLGRMGAPRPAAPGAEIAVVCGGTSDVPVAEEAALTAETLGCAARRVYDVGVAGIHRLLSRVETLRGVRAVVAVAGMEGALASVVGGLVRCPVVAVPTSVGYGASFGGLAALLAMLNSCAAGTAAVNIDNGFGAGVLAARIALREDFR